VNNTFTNLDNEINEMRNTLNSVMLNKPLTDESVIYYSQKLDKLIVKYEIYKYICSDIKKKAV